MFFPARPRAGFTLVELMIVVAIIAVLAAISAPKFANLIRKSTEAHTRAALGSLRSALSIYGADTEGGRPGDDLTVLTENGKYLERIPKCDLPPHHPESRQVFTSIDLPGTALFDTDVASWIYSNDAASNALGPRKAGEVWVGCLHTDTRNDVWSGS